MAVQNGAALRLAFGDALVAALAGGSCKLFSGAVPANCAASDPVTTIATGALPATAATNTAGLVSKAGTWTITGGAGAAGGTTATVFRLYTSTGVCLEQGTVTITGSGGDLTIDNPNIANAQVGSIATYTRTMPGA